MPINHRFSQMPMVCTAMFSLFSIFWNCAAAAAPETDHAVPGAGTGRTYQGYYDVNDRGLTVDIDGVQYRGHYSNSVLDRAALPKSESDAVPWGSAFAFASSAKVLQCRLDQGFPKVVGQCRDAEGRQFKLRSASAP